MKPVKVRKTALRIAARQNATAGGTTFDFEIGTLVQSPCKFCEMRPLLPDCATSCELLSQIQTTLASGISSGNSVSPSESYILSPLER